MQEMIEGPVGGVISISVARQSSVTLVVEPPDTTQLAAGPVQVVVPFTTTATDDPLGTFTVGLGSVPFSFPELIERASVNSRVATDPDVNPVAVSVNRDPTS